MGFFRAIGNFVRGFFGGGGEEAAPAPQPTPSDPIRDTFRDTGPDTPRYRGDYDYSSSTLGFFGSAGLDLNTTTEITAVVVPGAGYFEWRDMETGELKRTATVDKGEFWDYYDDLENNPDVDIDKEISSPGGD